MRPTALITGASRGLGAAIARELHPTYDLLLGARTERALTEILFELPGATGLPVELCDFDAVADAVRGIDRLDVLVHNASVISLGLVAESTVAQWRKTLETNVIAVAELTRLLLPALRVAEGHVVLINSTAGLQAYDRWSTYAASKFALRAFADALRLEEPQLRVTSIHPGRIDTDMQKTIIELERKTYNPAEYLTPQSVARAVRQALETPLDAHPTMVVLRQIPRDTPERAPGVRPTTC
ncbi:MAG: SDR family oxidoreductase [Acidobacteriaceae bacterium]|nr:SDR family oxidoreductase [Acidobacteriaceae bacterium]